MTKGDKLDDLNIIIYTKGTSSDVSILILNLLSYNPIYLK